MPDEFMTRRRVATLLLGAPLLGLGAASGARAAPAAVEIDTAVAGPLRAFMADARAVGISVGILQRGRSRCYHAGSVSKLRRQAADNRTLYPIASLTKTFTGLLLAQAQRDGKLRLDDDIRAYLDGAYPNLAFDGQPIRIYHLLNHRSGLPRTLPDLPGTDPGLVSDVPYAARMHAIFAGRTPADFYRDLHEVRLTAAPGAHFQYSNAAAQLAGDILERVYGRSYAALVEARITTPLGMTDTVFAPGAGQRARLATGYDDTGAPQPEVPETFLPAGGLRSTLADMLAYAAFQLAEQDPAVVLSHQPTFRDGDFTIGLNWQILTRGGRRVIFQDGSVPGFASLLVLQPASRIAVVLLANEIDRDTARRMAALADGIAHGLDANALALP
jgi:CubicO group peptidase (beta-lactamase class C family)